MVRHVAVEGLERASRLLPLLCSGARRAHLSQHARWRAEGRDYAMTGRQAIEDLLEGSTRQVHGDLEAVAKLFVANAIFQVAGADDASPMPTLVKGNAGIR